MARFSRLSGLKQRIKKSRQLKRRMKAQDREVLQARRKMQFERWVRGMGLYGKATAIIEEFDLPSNQKGRSILTAELQKTFLESLKEEKGKLAGKEKKCLDLVTRLQVIQLVLWAHQRNRKNIPIKKALIANRLAVEIVKRAEKTVAKGNSDLKKYFRDKRGKAEKRAKELEFEIKYRGGETLVRPKQKNLWEVANVGELLIEFSVNQLPEFTQTGFDKIDGIVSEYLPME